MSIVIETTSDFVSDDEFASDQAAEESAVDDDANQTDDDCDQADVANEPPKATEQQPQSSVSDDQDLLNQIWNAEMRCRGKEAIVEDLKEQLKEAKASYEQAVSALRKLACEANNPLPLFASPRPTPQPEPVVSDDDDPEDEAWKQRSFMDWLDEAGIEGMGSKKRDKLEEMEISTFGDFEAIRQEASKSGLHLSHMLPSGFGEKLTDRIEEAYLNAITVDVEPAVTESEQESDSDDDDYEDVE